ncbi:MAG: MarR family transcriptional regulator [Pseudolysinimonas sp.]
MSSRPELNARISEAMRDAIADAVLNNERIARNIGIHLVDMQTLGVIMRRDRPVTPTEIATMTGLPTSTVTRVVGRLEAMGFVQRTPDPEDRRSIVVTADPEALARVLDPNPYAAIVEALERHNDQYTDAELETVARWLESVTRGVAEG